MMQALYAWVRKLKIFTLNISTKDKLLFLEAFFLTGIIRLKILKVPFKQVKKSLGTYNEESQQTVDIKYYKLSRKIRWVVNTISKYTPWESLCLVQAMTAQKMLKKRGVATTLYLGINKDKNNEMTAHAWIRCGQMYVTGGDGTGYATVAKFTN
ncbi:MAG: lasso peptide biosynthesis B2 protein [Romboutsia sp.]